MESVNEKQDVTPIYRCNQNLPDRRASAMSNTCSDASSSFFTQSTLSSVVSTTSRKNGKVVVASAAPCRFPSHTVEREAIPTIEVTAPRSSLASKTLDRTLIFHLAGEDTSEEWIGPNLSSSLPSSQPPREALSEPPQTKAVSRIQPTMILPPRTPYLPPPIVKAIASKNCEGVSGYSDEELPRGCYHNVHYNTSYPLLPSKDRHAERSTEGDTPPSRWSNVESPCNAPYTNQKLSWNLLVPFFPDLGYYNLSDEDLIRDLATRLEKMSSREEMKKDTFFSAPALSFLGTPSGKELDSIFGIASIVPTALWPREEAIRRAYRLNNTLRLSYERIDPNTSEALNCPTNGSERSKYDPFSVQFAFPNSMGSQRYFVPKQPSMDTLPMLWWNASGESNDSKSSLIPEKYILSHSSFVRLGAAVLLSRFATLFQFRELLVEGMGEVFSLSTPLDLDNCYAIRELQNFIRKCLGEHLKKLLRRNSSTLESKAPAPQSENTKEPKAKTKQLNDSKEAPGGATNLRIPANAFLPFTDERNFECLSRRFASCGAKGTFQDHLNRCLEDGIRSPSLEDRRARAYESRTSLGLAIDKRCPLFIGSIPIFDTPGVGEQQTIVAPDALAEEATSFAYSFLYTAEQLDITGGGGSMFHSVLSGKLPELALYDFTCMVEKFRATLLFTSTSSGNNRQESTNKLILPQGGTHYISLYAFAAVMGRFFRNKPLPDIFLLCKGLVHDAVILEVCSPAPYAEGSGEKHEDEQDLQLIEAHAKALTKLIEEQRNNQGNSSLTHSVDDASKSNSNSAFFQKVIPIEALFDYKLCFCDTDDGTWSNSNFLDVARCLYIEELTQYTVEMQKAIIGTPSSNFQDVPSEKIAVKPLLRSWKVQQRSVLRHRHRPLVSTPYTTGLASVGAIFRSLVEKNPRKDPREVEEYTLHLLALYFANHQLSPGLARKGEDLGWDFSVKNQVEFILKIEWFRTPYPSSYGDNVYVDVCAFAAYCPLVLGRHSF